MTHQWVEISREKLQKKMLGSLSFHIDYSDGAVINEHTVKIWKCSKCDQNIETNVDVNTMKRFIDCDSEVIRLVLET